MTHIPQAIGPYRPYVVKGNILITSGQIPLDPETNQMVEQDIGKQTVQVLTNLMAVVEAAGCTKEEIIKTTIFLKDMNDFSVVNEIYGKVFTQNHPARSCIEVAGLPKDALIEIECIAVINEA